MKLLFIHQNFPGQFLHLAAALAAQGHSVSATVLSAKTPGEWKGVQLLGYGISPAQAGHQSPHRWLVDFNTKVIRAEACAERLLIEREKGFHPDAIIAHPGWGEALLVRELWPDVPLGLYCELYYRYPAADVGFDPEFPPERPATEGWRLRLKNTHERLQSLDMTAGIAPTRWQANSYPTAMRGQIQVIHDGVDTASICPAAGEITLTGALAAIDPHQPWITFINRNLEPYRGIHIFLRALPELLKAHKAVQIVIVGSEGQSYGKSADHGRSWKNQFVEEVRPGIADADWQRVHFTGALSRAALTSVLQKSTVHVYLTYPFVLSWSLIEAMSAGCAIVASDTEPVREVITDGVNGCLFNFFDIAALVGSVSTLLGDEPQRNRLAAAARRDAVLHYDLHTVCLPKQLEWTRRLAGSRVGPTLN